MHYYGRAGTEVNSSEFMSDRIPYFRGYGTPAGTGVKLSEFMNREEATTQQVRIWHVTLLWRMLRSNHPIFLWWSGSGGQFVRVHEQREEMIRQIADESSLEHSSCGYGR